MHRTSTHAPRVGLNPDCMRPRPRGTPLPCVRERYSMWCVCVRRGYVSLPLPQARPRRRHRPSSSRPLKAAPQPGLAAGPTGRERDWPGTLQGYLPTVGGTGRWSPTRPDCTFITVHTPTPPHRSYCTVLTVPTPQGTVRYRLAETGQRSARHQGA